MRFSLVLCPLSEQSLWLGSWECSDRLDLSRVPDLEWGVRSSSIRWYGLWKGEQGERKTHVMLPESGASAGHMRTVTSLCILRTCRLVRILSKCWWKLRMVWKILYQVMKWWSPSLSGVYSVITRSCDGPTMWNALGWLSGYCSEDSLCWVSGLVEPSHWIAVIHPLIL